jgi:hypothetical protein
MTPASQVKESPTNNRKVVYQSRPNSLQKSTDKVEDNNFNTLMDLIDKLKPVAPEK